LVPQRAVQQGPKGPFINVVGAEDKIEVREVQATSWKGSDWLIEEGLQPGERVVVEGFHRIQPGMQVSPEPFNNEESSSGSQSHESLPGPEGAQETP
jgi:membrane fusion protein (multidrug efflux system)